MEAIDQAPPRPPTGGRGSGTFPSPRRAACQAGYAGKCTVGLDVAASEFKVKDSPSGKDALYDLGMWDATSQQITGAELMEFYGGLIKDFPVVTIEDGFDEARRRAARARRRSGSNGRALHMRTSAHRP